MSLLFAFGVNTVDKVILPNADRTYVTELLERTYEDLSANDGQEIINE